MKIQLTESQARELWMDETLDFEGYDFEFFTNADEEDSGKYMFITNVYRDFNSGKYFLMTIQRSGSWHSDYDYFFDGELVEAEPVEVKTTSWKIKE
jgi:hypothetical protein